MHKTSKNSRTGDFLPYGKQKGDSYGVTTDKADTDTYMNCMGKLSDPMELIVFKKRGNFGIRLVLGKPLA
jgi:hypothetical protein